jgi:hypothetical protein
VPAKQRVEEEEEEDEDIDALIDDLESNDGHGAVSLPCANSTQSPRAVTLCYADLSASIGRRVNRRFRPASCWRVRCRSCTRCAITASRHRCNGNQC